MVCKYCGKDISDDAIFCPKCGKQIVGEKKCPKCGQINEIDSIFCKKCGAKLDEDDTAVAVEKEKPIKKVEKGHKVNISFIFNIVAMSLMILAMILVFGFIFTPFLSDSFFPGNEFTIINYLSEGFGAFKYLLDERQYIAVVNLFIVLVLFVGVMVVTLLFIGLSIPKLIKSIKEKSYYDFSKFVFPSYGLLAVLYIYFVNIVLGQVKGFLVDSNSSAPLALLIIIPIIFSFNIFTKAYGCGRKGLFSSIFNSASALVVFVLISVLIFNIGNLRFTIQATHYLDEGSSTTTTITQPSGNLDVLSFIIYLTKYAYAKATNAFVVIASMNSMSFLFEIAIVVLSVLLIKDIFTNVPNRTMSGVKGIVFTSIIVLLSITDLIMDIVSNAVINSVNDLETYGVSMVSSFNGALPILYIIMSTIALSGYIFVLIFSKHTVNNNE